MSLICLIWRIEKSSQHWFVIETFDAIMVFWVGFGIKIVWVFILLYKNIAERSSLFWFERFLIFRFLSLSVVPHNFKLNYEYNVEHMWRNIKHRGTTRHHLESYLAEFKWRKHVGADVFDCLLQTSSAFWPRESKIQK